MIFGAAWELWVEFETKLPNVSDIIWIGSWLIRISQIAYKIFVIILHNWKLRPL